MFHQSSCSSHHISLSVCLIGHFLQLLLTKNTFQINLQNFGHIRMVEEVRVPSEPDGKDVVKEDDAQDGKDVVKQDDPQGPVKVRHDHPIFKSVDDGDMERLQNYLEVDSLKLHDQLNNRKMWQINETTSQPELLFHQIIYLHHPDNWKNIGTCMYHCTRLKGSLSSCWTGPG